MLPEGFDVKGVLSKVSPEVIQKYLQGIEYPVSKQDLINKAREKGAPESVLNLLGQTEEKQYNNPEEVNQEIEKAE